MDKTFEPTTKTNTDMLLKEEFVCTTVKKVTHHAYAVDVRACPSSELQKQLKRWYPFEALFRPTSRT